MSVTTFLSYASERFQEVEPIAKYVRSLGAECWFDKHSLVGGDDWDTERSSAQRDCDLFLAVISRETVSRDGVLHREINEALERAKDKRPGKIYIVPLRLDDIDVPKSLTRYHWIDLRTDNWRAALAKTLEKSTRQNGRDASSALQIAAASQTSKGIQPHRVEEEDECGSRSLNYYTYEEDGAYWNYVNAELHRLGLGGLFEFRRLMADWPKDRRPSDWERSVSEFHRAGDLVSIRVGESYYFGQTPHPNHKVTTLNVLGPRCGAVNIRDLLEHPDAFDALLGYCNFILKQPGGHFYDDAFSLDHYAAQQSWELFEQFTLNDRGLVFHFSGTVLPHVMGVFEVYVPWEVLGRFVLGTIRDLLLEVGYPLGDPAPSREYLAGRA